MDKYPSDEIVSTETHPLYAIAVKQVGDRKKIPFTVIAGCNWEISPANRRQKVIYLEITHKKTGQKKDTDSIHSRRHKLNKNAGKTGCPSLYEKEKIDNAGKDQ